MYRQRKDAKKTDVSVPPTSDRLQILEPFSPMVSPVDSENMPVLIKTKGKTTTDHISPAGAWLKYRGHLDKISDNMLTGAINAWSGGTGTTTNIFTNEKDVPVPAVARRLQSARQTMGHCLAMRTTAKVQAGNTLRCHQDIWDASPLLPAASPASMNRI